MLGHQCKYPKALRLILIWLRKFVKILLLLVLLLGLLLLWERLFIISLMNIISRGAISNWMFFICVIVCWLVWLVLVLVVIGLILGVLFLLDFLARFFILVPKHYLSGLRLMILWKSLLFMEYVAFGLWLHLVCLIFKLVWYIKVIFNQSLFK